MDEEKGRQEMHYIDVVIFVLMYLIVGVTFGGITKRFTGERYKELVSKSPEAPMLWIAFWPFFLVYSLLALIFRIVSGGK